MTKEAVKVPSLVRCLPRYSRRTIHQTSHILVPHQSPSVHKNLAKSLLQRRNFPKPRRRHRRQILLLSIHLRRSRQSSSISRRRRIPILKLKFLMRYRFQCSRTAFRVSSLKDCSIISREKRKHMCTAMRRRHRLKFRKATTMQRASSSPGMKDTLAVWPDACSTKISERIIS